MKMPRYAARMRSPISAAMGARETPADIAGAATRRRRENNIMVVSWGGRGAHAGFVGRKGGTRRARVQARVCPPFKLEVKLRVVPVGGKRRAPFGRTEFPTLPYP